MISTLFLGICSITFAQTSTLNRPGDPIVMNGAQLTSFLSLFPGQIVGFKFENGVWTQIPVQVDERVLLDIVTPYGPLAVGTSYPPSPSNPKITYYCDSTTYTGTDPTTTFDDDDELVFMAKDAGGLSNGTTPSGIMSATCHEIAITDPLGGAGYVYLFQKAGSLQQGAGISYITYTSDLASSSGFPVNAAGTYAENTTIATAKYSWHFSAEWISDEYKLVIGSNTDILDRHKNFFSNGNCVRTENTFSDGENAFVAVKAGPIRAIRSIIGANSGPLTQRTTIFYEGRQDIVTDLRVHSIASIYDAFDYNSAANSMIYRNNLNTGGFPIDGVQDVIAAGDILWEQVSGAPGTISILHRRSTTLVNPTEASFTNYYDDNSSTPANNCTGDGQAWGTSGGGVVFTNGAVCTDPMGSNCAGTPWLRTLQTSKIIYSDAPNGAATTAADYNNKFDNPLITSVTACTVTDVPEISSINNEIGLFPNPCSGKINIKVNKHCDLKVYNTCGQIVLTTDLFSEKQIEIKDAGIYLFQFISETGQKYCRQIVVIPNGIIK